MLQSLTPFPWAGTTDALRGKHSEKALKLFWEEDNDQNSTCESRRNDRKSEGAA